MSFSAKRGGGEGGVHWGWWLWGGGVHYCAAECSLCQGVNLSEAVRCDIIYSEIPNLSALIFQPQCCLSPSARED